MRQEITAQDITNAWVLAGQLKAAGFSSRTANALVHGAKIPSLEHVRKAHWGDGSPGSGLRWELSCCPNMGPKGLAEVEAYRRGEHPGPARPPGPVRLSVSIEEHLLPGLDAWIEHQAEPRPTRAQALLRLAMWKLSEM
jgi:hypothetical protein